MNFENIPEELKRFKQWVTYQLETKPDTSKPTKVPYQPNGLHADSTDPATWSTFEQCVKAADRFTGIGFVFARNYIGIDFDKVRNPETGETEEWARNVIRELNSYSELSQSKTGWHVIVRGKLPTAGNRKGRMEMYDRDRFFVMTGLHATGTPEEIQTRDVADLQRRMLAGLDPRPVEPAGRSSSRRIGRDESGEDYKIIATLARKLRTKDAQLVEREIQRRFPERYRNRQEIKGDRSGRGYWQYSVERTLQTISAG